MARLKVTDRYALRAYVGAYVPLALSFTLLFVIADAFGRLDKFLRSSDPLGTTLWRYYSAMLPLVYLRFGAFLTLAAGMFAVARLQRNNELMPLTAGGLSIHRAVLPMFGCAALLGLVAAATAEVLIPRLAEDIRRASAYSKRKDTVPGIIRDRAGNTLYAGRYRSAEKVLEWVTFRRHDRPDQEGIVYHADRARWVATAPSAGHWLLEDGVVRDLAPEREPPPGPGAPRIPQRRFGAAAEAERIETSIIPIDVESLSEPVSLLSFAELEAQFRRQRYLPRLRVQLHERITLPLAHVLLLLLGLPFVLRMEPSRGGSFLAMLALVVICAVYFVTGFFFQALGNKGEIPAIVAAWAPVVAFGLLGIGMMDRVRS